MSRAPYRRFEPQPKSRAWNAADDATLTRLYAEHRKYETIAEALNCSPAQCRRRVVQLGLPPRRHRPPAATAVAGRLPPAAEAFLRKPAP